MGMFLWIARHGCGNGTFSLAPVKGRRRERANPVLELMGHLGEMGDESMDSLDRIEEASGTRTCRLARVIFLLHRIHFEVDRF